MSILAVGTVALDSIETPFGSADNVLGGSAVYLTFAARFFCSDVRLVGIVGSDFPQPYMDLLRTSGIDLAGLEMRSDDRTFAWAGRYHQNLNDRDTLATHLNVLATFNPTIPETYRDSRIVCLGNLDPTTQISILDQVEKPDLVICDTMNFWIERTPDALTEVLQRVDCLIINDQEARQLAGEANLIAAARAVQRMGPRFLVVKKGEHGALLFAGESVFVTPAYPLEHLCDPTGAGDCFAGAFAGYLSQAGAVTLAEMKRALVYASTLASFSVEHFGPQALLELELDMVEERAAALSEMAAIPPLKPIQAPVRPN